MRSSETTPPQAAAGGPPPGPGSIDPRRLRGLEPEARIPGRNLTKADIVVYRLDGERIALKTYAARPGWVRATLGRALLRRETAAYRTAAGAPGLPAFLGRVGPHALATAWIDGRTLADLQGESLGVEVFDRLEAVLEGLHRRGVALGDLHHRDVLVTAGGDVFVVDLAAAFALGELPGPLRRWLFERLAGQDRVAAARLRARWTGGDEEAAVAAAGASAAAWHRRGRRLKGAWNRLRGKRSP